MNDSVTDPSYAKWGAQMPAMLVALRALWQEGRPGTTSFSVGRCEPDIRADKMTPSLANRALFYGGYVVWGYVVRANNAAYIPGRNTFHGSVVYSADPDSQDSIFELAGFVNGLAKENSPPPAGADALANAMKDEQSSAPRIALPQRTGNKGECYFATVCLHRPRLPLGYVHDRLTPLLIAPSRTEWCCILPLRFWPDDLQKLWSSGPPANDPAAVRRECAKLYIEP